LQIAESVNAYIRSKKFGSEFFITATAKPGVTLTQLEKVIQEEIDKLKNAPPDEREMQRVTNSYESDYLSQLEYSGGFGGKANKLNEYYFYTGTPDYFNQDFARYRNTTRQQVSDVTRQYLLNNARVILSVVPEGKKELAAH
jgi:zinc protease